MSPGLSGQAFAAFGATSGQDALATDGRHASAEAVTAFADQFARLIRAFHVSSPLSKIQGALYMGSEGGSQRKPWLFSRFFSTHSRDLGKLEW